MVLLELLVARVDFDLDGSGGFLTARSKNSLRIGDMLAGTMVMGERARTGANDTIFWM